MHREKERGSLGKRKGMVGVEGYRPEGQDNYIINLI